MELGPSEREEAARADLGGHILLPPPISARPRAAGQGLAAALRPAQHPGPSAGSADPIRQIGSAPS